MRNTEQRPTLRQRLLMAAVTGILAGAVRAATQKIMDHLAAIL